MKYTDVFLYIIIYMCVFMCMSIYIYTCVFIYVSICVYIYTYVCIYIYICTCIYIYICMYVYNYIFMHRQLDIGTNNPGFVFPAFFVGNPHQCGESINCIRVYFIGPKRISTTKLLIIYCGQEPVTCLLVYVHPSNQFHTLYST